MIRRSFSLLLAATPLLLAQDMQPRDVIASIETSVVRANRDGSGTTWFHPRACLIPTAQGPAAFMTLQSIAGSDYFGPVHWSMSTDNAKTWSEPQPIPSLGIVPLKDGIDQGVCDVVPEYHPQSRTVLAVGYHTYYRGGKFLKTSLPRYPVYAIRRADGSWSEKHKLAWNDPRCAQLLSAGCGQRLTLPDGDVLVPVSFGSREKPVRSVTTLLCAYDGKTLSVKKAGREIPGKVGRGLIEPSLAYVDGIFYMTIRAEDGKGYVTTSRDGLTWNEPIPWTWQDGSVLAMSTTQQHWLTHSATLYLVYTRKAAENGSVFRWRAPLFMAVVDRSTLRLVKGTERVVFPLKGDGVKDGAHVPYSGNFHTMPLSPLEALITDCETFPANGYKGNQLQARVHWRIADKNMAR